MYLDTRGMHIKHQINRTKKYPHTHHITVKTLKIQNKETVLKAAKGRDQVTQTALQQKPLK